MGGQKPVGARGLAVLVLGCEGVTALSIARSVYELGLPVLGISVGRPNRYCARSCMLSIQTASNYGPELLGYLEATAGMFEKIALLPATDSASMFIAEFFAQLPSNFKASGVRVSEPREVFNKDQMLEIARRAGFRVPRHKRLTGTVSLSIYAKYALPFIVKSENSLAGSPSKRDFVVVTSEAERRLHFGSIDQLLRSGVSLTIQEFIREDDGYILRENFSVMEPSVGRLISVDAIKERIFPQLIGSSSRLHVADSCVDNLVVRFREEVAYAGTLDLEYFLKDSEAIFIEANFRAGTPVALCRAACRNIPLLEARILLGLPVPALLPLKAGVTYVREPSEIALMRAGRISLRTLVTSLWTASVKLLFDWRDLGPFLAFVFRV